MPPLWIHNGTFKSEWLRCDSGIPLGILPDLSLSKHEIQLQAGDCVVMFTDGIIEARNSKGEFFSLDRLQHFLENDWASPEDLVKALIGQALSFSQGRPQHDDITVLALKWH